MAGIKISNPDASIHQASEENEDEEAERFSTSSKDSSLSALTNLSTKEIKNQISKCLKLNAENKISDKNAFQLKMIDYLVYTLRNEDPNIRLNLNKASACLDASGKIYGLRVDKLHSDVIKVIGSRGEKRKEDESDDEETADQNNNDKRCRKKRKKTNVTTTADFLKGKVDCFNPLFFINSQVEAQTSDKLLQACVLQHANQSAALNHYNYVVLDKIISENTFGKNLVVPAVDDFYHTQISPSFAEFKFTACVSSDSESEDEVHNNDSTDFHFDLNDSSSLNNNVEDSENLLIKNTDNQNKINQKEKENIVDLKSVIENDPKDYEYSYIQSNHNIEWIGPSHWKLKFNKISKVNETEKVCKESEQVKGFRLSFSKTSKKKAKENFVLKMKKKSSNVPKHLFEQEDNLLWPPDDNAKKFSAFFLKPKDSNQNIFEKNCEENCRKEVSNCEDLDLSDFVNTGTEENDYTEDVLEQSIQLNFPNNSFLSDNSEAYVGENLVLAPKLIKKIFIPYSQRAKKIDMRLFKKYIKKSLKLELNKKIKSKNFSTVYKELATNLPRANAKSLSPGLAFVSLLHVMHEYSLGVDAQASLYDFTVQTLNENNAEGLKN